MKKENHNKWIYLLVGHNDNEDEMKPPRIYENIIIKYQQSKDDFTCLFNSIASTLHYLHENRNGPLEFVTLGNKIFRVGKENSLKDCSTQIDVVKEKILSCENLFIKMFTDLCRRKKRRKGKRENKVFDIFDKYDDTTNDLTIIVPIFGDSCKTHAFGLIDNLIFDSSAKHPMVKCDESLNWCCDNKGFLGIRFAY